VCLYESPSNDGEITFNYGLLPDGIKQETISVLGIIPPFPAKGIRTGYQNTSGKLFSKVLPFERNGGRYRTRTYDRLRVKHSC